LWSGDWERESADAARDRARRAVPTAEPEADPVELPPRRRRPSARTLAVTAVSALVVIAAAVVLANVLSGGAKPKPKPRLTGSVSPSPSTQTTTTGSGGAPNAQVAPGTQNPPSGGQTTPGGTLTAPGGGQNSPGGGVSPNPAGSGGQAPSTTSQFANQPDVQWLGMQIITSPSGAVVNSVQIGSQADIAGFEPGDVIAAVAGAQISTARQIQAAVAHVPVGGRVPVEIARGSLLTTITVTMVERPTVQP
jgi:hypothetical protein